MKKTVLLLAVLLAAIFARAASAQQTISYCLPEGTANVLAPWYCSQVNQAVSGIWYKWAPVASIAVLAAFSIAAVMLMIGVAMQNKRLRTFAVGELYEAAATAIIVGMFLTLAATMFAIIPSFATGPSNPYDTALTYISQTIDSTKMTMISLYNIVMIDSFYSSITLGVELGPAGGISQTASKALVGLVNPLVKYIVPLFLQPATTVLGLLNDALLALTVQFYMILFFMYIALPVFLIPGVIMRAIFPLRTLGGMMVSVAIAFYIIMPILFSIAYQFTNTSTIAALTQASAALNANGQGTQAQTNAASPTAPLVTEVNGLESAMGPYFLSVLFYPALILALTYFSVETLADFLGAATEFGSRMKLL